MVSRNTTRSRRAKVERAATFHDRPPGAFGKLDHLRHELAELEVGFQGTLIFPWDPAYNDDRQESNPAFQAAPEIIAYCLVPNDVRIILKLAVQSSGAFCVRSGGHSTTGYSVCDGIVIDVSGLKYVVVDKSTMTARVGAGTNFSYLNSHLDTQGVHIPGGLCGDVCVGGYMQGGGWGYTSRMFGMNCDSVLSFQMMLHDGTIITANSSTNRDLFWAVRGGTGGNFGVLLEVTYRVYVIPRVWGWTLAWPAAQAGPVLSALQAGFMRRGASPRLGYMANLCTNENQQLMVLQGMYVGSRGDGLAAIAPLQQMGNRPLLVDHVGSYAEMDDYLDDHPFSIPDVPNQGTKEAKQAGYIDRTLTPAEWQSIIDYYANTTHLPFQTAMIEPYGGAISAYGPHDSSFFHRNVDMDFFVDVFWVNDNDEAPAKQWLAGYFDLVGPMTNGHVYPNYPKRDLVNYQEMYWGPNVNTLVAIRKKYDPKHVFTFPQCIQPYARSDQPDDTPVLDGLGIDQSIVT